MKRDTGDNIKLGFMVTLSLILFVIAIYFIGTKQNLFGQNFYITAIFNNVNGLQSGNNVRFAGINVGTVDKIVIVSDSTVEVHMKMGEGVRSYIKKDAIASIGSDGLVGNMLVNISPGNGEQPAVENQDRIASFSRTDTDDILNALSSTNENIALLTRNLLTITEKINEGEGAITALLNDPGMSENLKSTFSNIEEVTKSALVATNRLGNVAQDIENGKGLLGFLLNDTTVESEMKLVLAKIHESGDNLQTASVNLQQATSALNQGEGTLNALLYDSSMSNDLKQSLANIKVSSALLTENMEAMRENFLFRKYFKEKNKENDRE
ncbi:MAG: MlaD family protein [Cyclobacteriaceae bacterium]|nr:MlaD family protein [Cyclobacteriaceae bacterium]